MYITCAAKSQCLQFFNIFKNCICILNVYKKHKGFYFVLNLFTLVCPSSDLYVFPLCLTAAAVPRRAPTPSGAVMWQEARKHERKLRGMMVDYKRRGERRREYYEKIVRVASIQSNNSQRSFATE